jgi:hypothetical protein
MPTMPELKERAVDEAKRFVIVFLYLWVLLSLFALHKSIILNEPSLSLGQGFAIVNALVLAKFMLLGEAFNLADNLKSKPIIYPVVFKSAVFAVLLMGCHALEEIAVGLWHGGGFASSVSHLGGETAIRIFMIGLIMFVVLMPFFAFSEIGRDLGTHELYRLFFVRRTKYVPVDG